MNSVDVAIPSYQYGRYVEQAAMTVLTQDAPNIRLLIIDNASTDGSQAIAKRLAEQVSRVSILLNERNQGYHDSYNRAVAWAKADALVILDADDLLVPGCLARGLKIMAENPNVAFTYGVEGRLTDQHLDPSRLDIPRTHWNIITGEAFIRRTCRDSYCDIGAPTVIRRTAAQKRAGLFRQSLLRTCDFEMYLRLALQGDVASTKRLQGIRRIHAAQLSAPYVEQPTSDFTEHEAAFESFFLHEGASLADAQALRWLARRKLGDYAYWHAIASLMRGRPGADESFQFAAARRQSPKLIPPFGFLFRRRWLRSAARLLRRATRQPQALPWSEYTRGSLPARSDGSAPIA